jgi:hypothetical protein
LTLTTRHRFTIHHYKVNMAIGNTQALQHIAYMCRPVQMELRDGALSPWREATSQGAHELDANEHG